MGWFTGDTIVTNQVAKEETRLIALALIILVCILIAATLFKANHAFLKNHISKTTVREVALKIPRSSGTPKADSANTTLF